MKPARVVHPFLLALFPTLALYAHNVRSLPIPPTELVGPLALSVGSAVILYAALRSLLNEPAKAGLLVSLLIVWFFSFGHIAGWLATWTEGIFNRHLFWATVVVIGLLAYLTIRSRRNLAALTAFLNVASSVLVVLNLSSIVPVLLRRGRVPPAGKVRVIRDAPIMRPNIYYIVLDAYARGDVLDEVFGFDNSGFLDSLRGLGFRIAERSYANYNLTHQSLASSLNFRYLDDLGRDVGEASSDREPLYELIRRNAVMAFLKEQGYRLITVASSIEPTDIKTADLYLGFAAGASEFRTVLLGTTPLPLFLPARSGDSAFEAHRRRILNALSALEETPFEKGPFFVFVHVMCPHPPFVFGPEGQPLEPDYSFSMVDADRWHGSSETAIRDYISGYRGQLAFLNKRVLAAVEAVLSRSAEPPVIILQGDHGSRAYADLDRPEASYWRENLAILNALFLPGANAPEVSPGLSPVNAFRLVFKTYLGADLELLEDRSFWTTWRRPYKFLPFDEATYGGTIESVKAAMRPEPPALQRR